MFFKDFVSVKRQKIKRGASQTYDTPSFSFLHFFVSSFFSSDFTDESGGILAYRITHGISRNFGRWPMARALYVLLLFFVTQISQMTQIFLCVDYFVPQISQIYTDFSLCGLFCPTNFTDDTDFSLCGLFCHADFADDADFSLWRLFRPTDFTDIHRFFFVGLFPTSGGYLHRPDRSPP